MYCVVVGDIINSKKIDIEVIDGLKSSIKETLSYINTFYMDSILADFGFVRGDAFEGVLLTHYQLPKILLEIIKSFYKNNQTKVRICVVLGELTAVSTDRNEANGPAFYKAIDTLDRMKDEKSEHWFQVSIITASYAQPLLNGILSLISSITEEWTDRQREIIWEIEESSEQQTLVSRKLNISRSVVNKQLKAANYYVYRKAWLSIEEFFINLEKYDITEEKSFLAYYGAALRNKYMHEYTEAYTMLLKTLEIAEKELDQDNPQLIIIYNCLSEILIQLKDFGNAEKYIRLSLEAQKDLPKSRLIYAATLNNLGDLFLEKNIFHEAEENYETALNIAVNAVGNNGYFINECNKKAAAAFHRQKEYRKALSYYSKVLEFSRDHSQRDPIILADALYHIARCCSDSGDKNKVIEYANEALIIYKYNLPPRHESIKAADKLIEMNLSGEEFGNDN